MSNVVKTFILLVTLTLLLMIFGEAVGGVNGMMTAFVFACVMNFAAYWFSDKMVLAMYRAQPIAESDAPDVYEIVHKLTSKAGLPMPKIYLIPSAAPNAFATGRDPNHAVVAVTQGIMEILTYEELEGVLAHELSHVKHRDILIATIAATLAGAVSMLASMVRWVFMFGGGGGRDDRREGNPLVLLIMAIVVPIAAMLVQLAVSRSREFDADASGGELAGNPLYLASALRKLEAGAKQQPMYNAEPATAHLFIVNPLTGGGFAKLFSTHPPTEERIARLEKMAREKGM
ncbi:MAG: zinc metalloprotease HtpX [Candidatus Omnitrophica bacterium]|nr:zinc metalloprotease HtpX [Candidatus Omnitrophota bacterium]